MILAGESLYRQGNHGRNRILMVYWQVSHDTGGYVMLQVGESC